MKKISMTLVAVFCCAMTTTIFTACGDDDEKSAEQPGFQTKIVAYQVDYSLEFPKEEQQNVLGPCGNYYLLCDKIEIGYIDENGQEQKEVVNNGKWTKSVVYKKSLDGYLKMYLTKPVGLDAESLPYNYYTAILDFGTTLLSIKAIYDDGTKKSAELNSFIYRESKPGSLTLPKETTLQYMEERMKTEAQILTIKFNI